MLGWNRIGVVVLLVLIGAFGLSALAQEGPTENDKQRYQRYLATKNEEQLKKLRQLAGKDVPLELFLWRLEKQAGVTLGGGGTTDPTEPPPSQPPTKN
jgi:hypothetical protein